MSEQIPEPGPHAPSGAYADLFAVIFKITVDYFLTQRKGVEP
jgi:hypothetical protein